VAVGFWDRIRTIKITNLVAVVVPWIENVGAITVPEKLRQCVDSLVPFLVSVSPGTTVLPPNETSSKSDGLKAGITSGTICALRNTCVTFCIDWVAVVLGTRCKKARKTNLLSIVVNIAQKIVL
jgi:hypothetical protein